MSPQELEIATDKILSRLIDSEKQLAKLGCRHEGLIYVFASGFKPLCKNCTEIFFGKVFLLYDGRKNKRYQLPKIPNPRCKAYEYNEYDDLCCLHWSKINPEYHYLKKEKQFYRSVEKYVDTWHMKMKVESSEEWKEWINNNPQIEIYDPPSSLPELTDFEIKCLERDAIRVTINNIEFDYEQLGHLYFIILFSTIGKIQFAGIKIKQSEMNFDFTEHSTEDYIMAGKNYIIEILRSNKSESKASPDVQILYGSNIGIRITIADSANGFLNNLKIYTKEYWQLIKQYGTFQKF